VLARCRDDFAQLVTVFPCDLRNALWASAF
jgi:hypothetical protein